MTVRLAWLLFALIAAWLIALPVLLHAAAAERQIDLECDATHCRIARADLMTIIEYVEYLQRRQGKSCS